MGSTDIKKKSQVWPKQNYTTKNKKNCSILLCALVVYLVLILTLFFYRLMLIPSLLIISFSLKSKLTLPLMVVVHSINQLLFFQNL